MQNTLSPDKWITNYADYLFSYAIYRINDREQAEDLVQETFLSAYKSREQYQGNANEKTWLTSILKNKIIDLYRKKSRTSKVVITELDYGYFFNEEGGSHWNNLTAPKAMPISGLESLQQKELNQIIDQCMELLPSTWNQVSKMKLIDDEKTETICKAFDITPSNFWVIMHRAKLQLRDCIEKKSEIA
jgi:RNA polymerase sigma-70 factor (TIGR02943 family)